ncbi:ferredoxin-thioredoxin reductase catalytic domain-containing protein [Chloroflexota bacterium]
MNDNELPDSSKRKALYTQLNNDAEAAGYHLNPDVAFTKDLVDSLLTNRERYGYQACPCRLASGDKLDDMDIICPCDYRDADIADYGTCYCALYVSKEITEGEKQATSIPERRPPQKQRAAAKQVQDKPTMTGLPLPVWRCSVCGYLCAREQPPEICPICKADKERFQRFI